MKVLDGHPLAMSCGVPVVCSETGSLKETAGSAALIVDPYNNEDIAEAVTLLLYDPLIRQKKIRQGLRM